MPHTLELAHLGLVLVIAFSGAVLARKLKQPLIVGYILAGIASSPLISAFHLQPTIEQVAEIGIALLLFSIGLEFSFARLARVKLISGLGATVQILTVILLSLLILPLLGISTPTALFIGSAFALSSTAVVARLLESRGELDTWPGEIAIGWLLVQDLAVLPLVILLPALTQGTGLSLATLVLVLKAVALVSLALVIGYKIVPLMVKIFANFNSRELLLLGVICLMFGFAILTTQLGLGLAIGAFLAGLLMSSTTAHYAIFAEVRPLRELFSIIFFVSLGLMIAPRVLLTSLPIILIATLAIIVIKFALIWLILSYFGQHPRVKFLVAAFLVQIGEFGFVLMQIGYQSGVTTQRTVSIISGIALISILLTPWLINQAEKLYQRFFYLQNHHQKIPRALSSEFHLQNHVVICGYGRVGKWLGRTLQLFQLPFVVIDFNRHLVSQLKDQGLPAIYGDSSDLEILKTVRVSKAKAVVITIPNLFTQQLIIDHCQRLNPGITTLTRAHHEELQAPLKLQGATHVIQPEFEAALSLTRKVLQRFGKSQVEIANKLKRIRLEHGQPL